MVTPARWRPIEPKTIPGRARRQRHDLALGRLPNTWQIDCHFVCFDARSFKISDDLGSLTNLSLKTAAPEPEKGCAPGRTRTFDLRIRNPLLYPAELRAQIFRGRPTTSGSGLSRLMADTAISYKLSTVRHNGGSICVPREVLGNKR